MKAEVSPWFVIPQLDGGHSPMKKLARISLAMIVAFSMTGLEAMARGNGQRGGGQQGMRSQGGVGQSSSGGQMGKMQGQSMQSMQRQMMMQNMQRRMMQNRNKSMKGTSGTSSGRMQQSGMRNGTCLGQSGAGGSGSAKQQRSAQNGQGNRQSRFFQQNGEQQQQRLRDGSCGQQSGTTQPISLSPIRNSFFSGPFGFGGQAPTSP